MYGGVGHIQAEDVPHTAAEVGAVGGGQPDDFPFSLHRLVVSAGPRAIGVLLPPGHKAPDGDHLRPGLLSGRGENLLQDGPVLAQGLGRLIHRSLVGPGRKVEDKGPVLHQVIPRKDRGHPPGEFPSPIEDGRPAVLDVGQEARVAAAGLEVFLHGPAVGFGFPGETPAQVHLHRQGPGDRLVEGAAPADHRQVLHPGNGRGHVQGGRDTLVPDHRPADLGAESFQEGVQVRQGDQGIVGQPFSGGVKGLQPEVVHAGSMVDIEAGAGPVDDALQCGYKEGQVVVVQEVAVTFSGNGLLGRERCGKGAVVEESVLEVKGVQDLFLRSWRGRGRRFGGRGFAAGRPGVQGDEGRQHQRHPQKALPGAERRRFPVPLCTHFSPRTVKPFLLYSKEGTVSNNAPGVYPRSLIRKDGSASIGCRSCGFAPLAAAWWGARWTAGVPPALMGALAHPWRGGATGVEPYPASAGAVLVLRSPCRARDGRPVAFPRPPAPCGFLIVNRRDTCSRP